MERCFPTPRGIDCARENVWLTRKQLHLSKRRQRTCCPNNHIEGALEIAANVDSAGRERTPRGKIDGRCERSQRSRIVNAENKTFGSTRRYKRSVPERNRKTLGVGISKKGPKGGDRPA